MKLIHSEDIKAIHLRGENIINKIINALLLVSIFAVIVGGFFAQKAFAEMYSSKQDEFLKYINKDTFKYYKNGLFLGMFNSHKEAEEYIKQKKINPITLEPYDVAIAFGMSGNAPWVKAWEVTRVVGDNLSFSPQTNYSKINGLKFDYLVAHSNGNDVANNAIKAGIIKVRHLISIAPPAGFKKEIKNLPVHSVEIYRTKGDPVAEVLGKKTVVGFLQRLGDINIGVINRTTKPIIGIEITKSWPDKIQPPEITERTFEGPYYFTDKPHHYETNANNIALDKMYSLNRTIDTADPNIADKGKINSLQESLSRHRSIFPNAVKKFDKTLSPILSYWTQGNRNQSMTEAQIMTEMTPGKKRAFIVGNGPEAELMYKNMTNRLGEGNVKWSKQDLGRQQLQLQARKFGADVILGTKEYGPFTKEYRPLASASVYTGSVPIDGPKIYDAGSHTPMDLPDKMSRAGAGYGKPGSFIPTDIGGVMLQGVADVSDATDAGTQLTDGTFSLIFQNANAEIDMGKLRKFVTALWAVYFSEEGPGISIDPIAPGVDKHLIRYIGRKVINSDLGRVMREADYAMKKWAVGIERPDIDGFKSVDALTAQHGLRYIGASRRFWFVPEDMRFKRAGDAVLFDSGGMTLKTEYVLLNKEVRSEPADKDFAQFFTQKYDEIAEKYPVYRELFEYAKLVSLASYLKDKGIPMLWFLLANKDIVITENSPGTVDALAKKSDYYEYITIEGGVDLDIKSSEVDYVFDMKATKAINKAYKLYGSNSLGKSSVLPSESITFETKDNDFTLTPSHILALSNGTVTGDKYQTDIAVRNGKGPGLELARYYNPEYKGPATFGKGWHLLIPYRVETHGKGKIEFGNAIIPEKMVVKNLLTGRKEVLAFSKDRYSIAGYVPDDLENSSFIGLFLLSDASFRLADKLGNEFQFNHGGHLTEMVFSKEYHVKLEYGYAESKKEEFNALPYRIEPVTDKYEEFLNIRLPKNMRVVDVINGKEEVFVFNNKNKYKIAGYTPLNENNSKYKILAIMTDGSYDLIDKQGNEVSFDPAGRLNRIRARVIKGLSQGNYKIKFDYEFNNGGPGIKEAHVLKGDQSTALYAMKYEYDNDGRLSKVLTPAGKDMEIKYDEERVIVAMK